jgi:hypothetical protein
VVLRYSNVYDQLTSIGAGLTYTYSNTGVYHLYQFTAGSDTIKV